MFDALPPQLYIPAKPAIIRAHQGDLDALAALEREKGIKAVLPGLTPLVTSGGPVAVTFCGGANSSANANTYTFNNFVVPRAGLVVVVSISEVSSNYVTSSITLGGAAMTLHDDGIGSTFASRIASAGTYNIVVNVNTGGFHCTVAVLLLENVRSTTPTDVGSAYNGTSTTSASSPVVVPPGGVVIHSNWHNNVNATSWSHATEVYDVSPDTPKRSAVAYRLGGPAGVSYTEVASWSGGTVSTRGWCIWR